MSTPAQHNISDKIDGYQTPPAASDIYSSHKKLTPRTKISFTMSNVSSIIKACPNTN